MTPPAAAAEKTVLTTVSQRDEKRKKRIAEKSGASESGGSGQMPTGEEYATHKWRSSFTRGDSQSVDAILTRFKRPGYVNTALIEAERLLFGSKVVISEDDRKEFSFEEGVTEVTFLEFCQWLSLKKTLNNLEIPAGYTGETGQYTGWLAGENGHLDLRQILFLWAIVSTGYKGLEAVAKMEGDRSVTVTVANKAGVGSLFKVPADVIHAMGDKGQPQNIARDYHLEIGRLVIAAEEFYKESNHPLLKVARELKHPLWSWSGPLKALPPFNASLELLAEFEISFMQNEAMYAFEQWRPALYELEDLDELVESMIRDKKSTARIALALFFDNSCCPRLRGKFGSKIKSVLVLLRAKLQSRDGVPVNASEIRTKMSEKTQKGLSQEEYIECVVKAAKVLGKQAIDRNRLFDVSAEDSDDEDAEDDEDEKEV